MSIRLRVIEACYWILAVAAMITGGLAVPAFVLGEGLLTLKYLLFVVGFLCFGIGSWSLWARSRKRPTIWPDVDTGIDLDDDLGFEQFLWELPGLRGEWLPPHERLGRSVKLFLTGVLVLVISYTMEAGFGVTV